MKVVATEELSPQQHQAVVALQRLVHQREGLQRRLFLTNRLNADPSLPCFFLGYKEELLVSVLVAFFPTFEEVEISGYTHPDYRNRGHFSSLLRRALSEYASTPFSQFLLLVEERSLSGSAYVQSRAPTCMRSELILALTKKTFTAEPALGELSLVQHYRAEPAALLMSEIFGDSLAEARDRLSLMLVERGRKVFLYRYKDQNIGVLNAQPNDDGSYSLYGVGIKEAFRKRGFGKAMLQLALSELFEERDEVRLEVESTNEAAVALYQSLGFLPHFVLHFCRYRAE